MGIRHFFEGTHTSSDDAPVPGTPLSGANEVPDALPTAPPPPALEREAAWRVYEICVTRGYVDERDWDQVVERLREQLSAMAPESARRPPSAEAA